MNITAAMLLAASLWGNAIGAAAGLLFLRREELFQSFAIIRQVLGKLPGGPVRAVRLCQNVASDQDQRTVLAPRCMVENRAVSFARA